MIEFNFGKIGTAECDEFEAGYESFKIGVLNHDASIEKGCLEIQSIDNEEYDKNNR